MSPEKHHPTEILRQLNLTVTPLENQEWSLSVETGTGLVDFLALKADGTGFSTPVQSPDLPEGKDRYFALLDQLGFKLQTGQIVRDQKQVFWLHTNGFGWDDEPMGDSGLFLYFDASGNPQGWEAR